MNDTGLYGQREVARNVGRPRALVQLSEDS